MTGSQRLGAMRRRTDDRGSVSLWVVIFAFATIALLILVVDGGQVMNAKSRAADIGEQAARAAANDIDVGALRGAPAQVPGQPAQAPGAPTVALAAGACDLNNGPAEQLVQAYAAGVPGATAKLMSCVPGTAKVGTQPALTVTVTVQVSVPPTIPIGVFSQINVTATETAYLACGDANQRQAC